MKELSSMAVNIKYTNYKGETNFRNIIPKGIRFASSQWHPEAQWLLDAYDLGKNEDRTFAIKDIKDWCLKLPPPSAISNSDSVSTLRAREKWSFNYGLNEGKP